MAMWDARGKTEGVSLATLLGGARRDRIELTEIRAEPLGDTIFPALDRADWPAVCEARIAALLDQHLHRVEPVL